MRKEYIEELEKLKQRMEQAEAFAAKIPVFAEKILKEKYTETMNSKNFGDYYKDMPMRWGIWRDYFSSTRSKGCEITNYLEGKTYNTYLFRVYINTISLYDLHEKFGLDEYLKDVTIFFFDTLNCTFYIEDAHIGAFMEALYKWYQDALVKSGQFRLEEKKRELERQLNKIQAQLAQVS